MSKSIKVLWIVIGSLFALGIILAIVGFSLGGTGSAWVDRSGVHFGGRDLNAVEIADRNSAAFDNVEVLLVEADIELVEGDNYGYEFVYSGRHEPMIEISGSTLKVIEDENNWSFDIFGLWSLGEQEAKLKVYVPKGTVLNQVSISTASGDTLLASNTVEIRNLTCQSASGGINIDSLELEKLDIDVASGNVTLQSVTAEEAEIILVSGRLRYDDATLESLVLDMASGSAKVNGTITDSLVVRMVSGDADFDLLGNEEDYKFTVDSVSGDIRVNGRSFSSGDWPGRSTQNSSTGGSGRIDIETASGSININFK